MLGEKNITYLTENIPKWYTLFNYSCSIEKHGMVHCDMTDSKLYWDFKTEVNTNLQIILKNSC